MTNREHHLAAEPGERATVAVPARRRGSSGADRPRRGRRAHGGGGKVCDVVEAGGRLEAIAGRRPRWCPRAPGAATRARSTTPSTSSDSQPESPAPTETSTALATSSSSRASSRRRRSLASLRRRSASALAEASWASRALAVLACGGRRLPVAEPTTGAGPAHAGPRPCSGSSARRRCRRPAWRSASSPRSRRRAASTDRSSGRGSGPELVPFTVRSKRNLAAWAPWT